MNNYELIGVLTISILLTVLILLALGLVLAYVLFKSKKMFLPKFVLFILDALYMPAKKIVSFLGGNDDMVDLVSIEIRNILFKERLKHTPYNERVVLVPQCLRKADCPAKLDPIEGIICLKCGRCDVVRITKKAQELGYIGVYTLTGGGFAKRVLKKTKPHAVLAVACPNELNQGMLFASDKGIPCHGVPLLKDGCFETNADLSEILYQMESYEEDSGKKK